jgi:membrane-associated protein
MASMDRRKFTLYTVVGSFLWVFLMMIAGVIFGQIDWVKKHFEAVVLGIIVISMLPVAFEIIVQFLDARKNRK